MWWDGLCCMHWSEAVFVWKFTICCGDTLSYFWKWRHLPEVRPPTESNKSLRLLLLASLKMFYTASLWGCVCDVLRYRLHVSCRVRMLEHSTRAQVVLLPSHSLRANCYLPAKRGLTIPQSKVGFLPRVERVEHHFQLEKYNHLYWKKPTNSKKKKLITITNERGGSLP